jgi:hypothetical protein
VDNSPDRRLLIAEASSEAERESSPESIRGACLRLQILVPVIRFAGVLSRVVVYFESRLGHRGL